MVETFDVWQLVRIGKFKNIKEGDCLYFAGPMEPEVGIRVAPVCQPLPVIQIANNMVTVEITIKLYKTFRVIHDKIDKYFMTRDEWLEQRFRSEW